MPINDEKRKRDEERRRALLLANAAHADAVKADFTTALTIGLAVVAVIGGLLLFGLARGHAATAAPTAPQATATANAAAAAHATAAAAATATAVASAPEGPLTVPFTGSAKAAQTTKSYHGSVRITVSGTGQAAGTRKSDAFYIFTDLKGNPLTPYVDHAVTHTLCIDGKSATTYLSSIPPYSKSHTYTFTFTAPGGPLTFGVCDNNYTDNAGSFTITFS